MASLVSHHLVLLNRRYFIYLFIFICWSIDNGSRRGLHKRCETYLSCSERLLGLGDGCSARVLWRFEGFQKCYTKQICLNDLWIFISPYYITRTLNSCLKPRKTMVRLFSLRAYWDSKLCYRDCQWRLKKKLIINTNINCSTSSKE